jgi:hypothetical protein
MRTKLVLLGLCAMIVGMMSMSAGAAQGATLSWLILNAAKTTETELKAEVVGEKDSEHLSLEGEVSGLKLVITCTNLTLKETSIEPVGKVTGGKVVFTGCAAYKKVPLGEPVTKCTVKTTGAAAGTVETATGKGELQLHEVSATEKEVVTRIEPAVGGLEGTLATLRLEGGECEYPEQVVVHGALYLKDCQKLALKLGVKHLVEDLVKLTSLYLGGHSAKQLEITKIKGSAWIKLAGAHAGLEWSAMDV